MFTVGQHASPKYETRGSIFEKRNIKCGSEVSELLWLLLVTFYGSIWQQAHGRAQLFDEYFESEGPKDSAGHMPPSVFALWNDNVASLKRDAGAMELPFLVAENIIGGQTWRNRLRCIYSCDRRLMPAISQCVFLLSVHPHCVTEQWVTWAKHDVYISNFTNLIIFMYIAAKM